MIIVIVALLLINATSMVACCFSNNRRAAIGDANATVGASALTRIKISYALAARVRGFHPI